MSNLIFDEKTMYDGNIFKFEERLKSHINKYIEGGAILVTYFSQDEINSTVDRGIKNIDEIFGNKSPLRFNQINNFPLYGFGQTNPENNDENQIEDIDVEGSCIILPSTISPKPMDFFIINHLKMTAIFEVKNVVYDSMKVEGYYRIDYRLHSTSKETLDNLKKQVVTTSFTELNMIGSNTNPIIREEDYILKSKISKMVNEMIKSYISLFYNERHNCFLFNNSERGELWFDACANRFMATYSLINYFNSNKVILLTKKIDEPQFEKMYTMSIFKWIDKQAPSHLIQKFPFMLKSSNMYQYSSFCRWSDEVQIILPISENLNTTNLEVFYYFNDTQFNSFLDKETEPLYDYEKLLWKYFNDKNLSIHDVSLYIGDSLMHAENNLNIYLYTPIIIYILKTLLRHF